VLDELGSEPRVGLTGAAAGGGKEDMAMVSPGSFDEYVCPGRSRLKRKKDKA